MLHDILTQEISLFRKKILESPNKRASKYFSPKCQVPLRKSENAGPHVLS